MPCAEFQEFQGHEGLDSLKLATEVCWSSREVPVSVGHLGTLAIHGVRSKRQL